MLYCKECGKTSIIMIAESDGVEFYSCITEGCSKEAQLLVYIGDNEFVRYDRVFDTFKEIVKYGNPDKANDNKSKS